jgi:pimeloyl-ACP methyl ester carboxylesterase
LNANGTKELFTSSKARLRFIRSNTQAEYHWLFLPGGPGLGSESLADLVSILELPGTLWFADLPGDGSNHTDDDVESFSHWSQALLELVSMFDNVILVAHSSGGFFTLATLGLEEKLKGLILMNSAPDSSWQEGFATYVKNNPIAEAERLQLLYQEKPTDELLKQLTIACAAYCSMDKSIDAICALLRKLPFNCKIHLWAEKNFDTTYRSKWIPKSIPTLIFSGDNDKITPITLFKENKDFHRKNIKICSVDNAAHFPWIDNPEQVKALFCNFYDNLTKKRE